MARQQYNTPGIEEFSVYVTVLNGSMLTEDYTISDNLIDNDDYE